MKNKLKNTLEHEVELLGRSISVLAIAGLLVVGGASAALLNTFGTVEGNAQVTQSVQVNGNTYDEESSSFTFEGDAVGGNTIIATGDTITNNANESVDINVSTTVTGPDVSDGDTSEGADVHQVVLREQSGSDSGSDPDDTREVTVETVTDETTEEGYALHFEDSGEATPDYASATYRVSGVSVSDITDGSGDVELSLDAKLGDDGVNAPDEVFLQLEDGTLLFYNFGQTGSQEWSTYTAENTGWTEITPEGELGSGSNLDSFSGQDVEAVSVGQGSPSEETGTREVNGYIDNIQVDEEDVEDLATTQFTTTLIGGETVELATVSEFDVAAYPGTYDFTTNVSPPTSD